MLLTILLQAGGSLVESIISFLPLLGIIIVFYFFFLRPQQKRENERTSFVEGLKKGDEVVTSSGIIGRVNKIEGHTVSLQVDTKTYIKVTKGAISKEMSEAYANSPAELNEKAS